MGRRKLIRNIVSKPSMAVQAMIDGLLKQSQRPDFKIRMRTYGFANDGICYGCAATCAVQQLTGIELSCDVIDEQETRAEALRLLKDDERQFEEVINSLRNGSPDELYSYLYPNGIPNKLEDKFTYFHINLPDLYDSNWKENLPEYQKFAYQLRAAGY